MLGAIALLFVCQLAGEAIHRLTGVPLPGSVIGMMLLLGWLAFIPRERPGLTQVSGWLTAHLSIMLLPPAVGLMDEGAVLSRHGVSILAATAFSTILTMLVTVWVFRLVARREEPGPDGPETAA